MSLKEFKCKNCTGQSFSLIENKLWICDYCGTPYREEEETTINNNTINNNIKADYVIVDNKKSDFVIKCGELVEYTGESTDVVVPKNVIKIGERVFLNSMLTSLVLSETVKECCIRNCKSLSSVKILSSSADSIEFHDCPNLNSIVFYDSKYKQPSENKDVNSFSCFQCNELTINNCGIENINLPLYIKNFNFQQNSKLKSVNISTFSKATSIGPSAFKDCTSLESISIGKSVKSIDCGAFENCTSLKAITDAKMVEYIGNYAFANCTSLKYVYISSNVESIGDYAFKNCTSLETIRFNHSLPKLLGVEVFENCINLVNIESSPGFPVMYLDSLTDLFPTLRERKEKNLCIYCGGKLSPRILFYKCKNCKRIKSNKIIKQV